MAAALFGLTSIAAPFPCAIVEHYNPNNLDITYIFSDLEHVANAGWLPRRRLHIIGQGAIVDRYVVTEIDTLKRPERSIFQLDFPEPITCFDQAKKLVYPRRKTWSLLNLPGSSSAGVRPFPPSVPQPKLPGEVVPNFSLGLLSRRCGRALLSSLRLLLCSRGESRAFMVCNMVKEPYHIPTRGFTLIELLVVVFFLSLSGRAFYRPPSSPRGKYHGGSSAPTT